MLPIKDGKITTAYNLHNPKLWPTTGYHTGADFAAKQGTPVLAARPGKIIKTGMGCCGAALGIAIVIKGPDGTYDRYCHLSVSKVKPNTTVTAGQTIGEVGQTGNATGPHLHFERSRTDTWQAGQHLNPTTSFNWQPPKPQPPTATKYTVTTPRGLHGRSGPGLNYPITKVVPQGKTLQIIKTSNGWGKTPTNTWFALAYCKKG